MPRIIRLIAVTLLAALVLAACGTAGVEEENTPAPGQTPEAGATTDETNGALDAPEPGALDALTALEDALRAIHEEVSPSVVNIQITGPTPRSPVDEGPIGTGSGFVWDTEGHIVTNDHVVAGATRIRVTFADGTNVPAETVGRDADSDLAVIRVDVPPDQLRPVTLADFSQVTVGQMAVAIGNPFGLEGTMTQGIVSALGRLLPVRAEGPGTGFYSIPDVIQTDASVNPGNSGGVLVDIRGRLIGVPSAMISRGMGSAGIGFAIPSAIVEQVVPVLIEEGSYQHPWLGVQVTSVGHTIVDLMDLPPGQTGALVVDVTSGSPAEEAGLRGGTDTAVVEGAEVAVGGDIIVAIDGEPVRDTSALIAYQVRNTRPGETITLSILRNGEPVEIQATMGVRP